MSLIIVEIFISSIRKEKRKDKRMESRIENNCPPEIQARTP